MVEPVTVETVYGPLVFPMRGVRVFDPEGVEVGYFACEDSPADFDTRAREAGWRRVGHDGGVVFLERVQGLTASTVVGSGVWSLFRLGCALAVVAVLIVIVVAVVVAFV